MRKISHRDILYDTRTGPLFYKNYKWSIPFKIVLYTCNLYNIVDQYNLIFLKKDQPGGEKVGIMSQTNLDLNLGPTMYFLYNFG